MATYAELVYMVYDELKITSDDNIIERDHIIYLINKYRSLLLKQRFSGKKKVIPIQLYQELEITFGENGKSVKPLPKLIDFNGLQLILTTLQPTDFRTNVTIVTPDRFPYVNSSRWLSEVYYGTILYDDHFYIKPTQCKIEDYPTIKLQVILENPLDILFYNEDEDTDPLSVNVRIEFSMVNDLIGLIIKELYTTRIIPDSEKNDAMENFVILPKQSKTSSPSTTVSDE